MNRQLRLVLFFAVPVLMLGAAAGLPTTGSHPLAPTIQQRIDALLKRRLNPEPLPADLPNPFQVNKSSIREHVADDLSLRTASLGDLAAVSGAVAPAQPRGAAASSAEVLTAAAARLKVGGFIVLKDQIQVVINGVPRREGDMIAADWNNSLVYLKVVRVLSSEIILRYGDAEATLKL